MEAKALSAGEASMSLRVIRKDGSEEHHEGTPVQVSLPADLVAEYKNLMRRVREIEALFIQHLAEHGE